MWSVDRYRPSGGRICPEFVLSLERFVSRLGIRVVDTATRELPAPSPHKPGKRMQHPRRCLSHTISASLAAKRTSFIDFALPRHSFCPSSAPLLIRRTSGFSSVNRFFSLPVTLYRTGLRRPEPLCLPQATDFKDDAVGFLCPLHPLVAIFSCNGASLSSTHSFESMRSCSCEGAPVARSAS